MPTLRIEGDDNHFVIKTKTHELKFQSWQVTDAGMCFFSPRYGCQLVPLL